MYNLFKKVSKFMKISFLLLFVCIAQLLAINAKGQNAMMHIPPGTLSVGQFLNEVEKQTDYLVIYSNREVDTQRKVDLVATSGSVAQYLENVFSGTNVRHEFENDYIILTKRAAFVSSSAVQQGITVAGTIVDSDGTPMPGVNVIQKGTLNGTVTNFAGKYSITVPAIGAVLQYSFVGYQMIEKTVEGSNVIDVMMIEESKMIDEVVVIGYGTRQRKHITGAVDQISASMVENRPVGNTMQALQGASPNLIIQQRSSNPNDNTLNINIRGVNTTTNNDPLLLIDGIITDLASLNRINPDDIASISVLKDAGSAAIYGSRASSGVLLITTKQGAKNQKPVVRINTMVGLQTPHFLFHPVKGYENAILRNQAEINANRAPIFTPEEIQDLYDHKDQKYFMHQILEPALQQTYTGSISGGSEYSTFMVSLGYYDQASNFVGGDYGLKRYNFRTNLTSEYGRLKISSLLAYNRIMHHQPNAPNAIQNATRFPVYYYNRMKDDRGRYVDPHSSLGALESGGFNDRSDDNIIGSLSGELKIIEGLKAKGVLGIDLTAHHRYIRSIQVGYYADVTAEEPISFTGQDRNTEDYNEKRYRLNTQFMLDYDRIFKEKHHVTGLVGVSNESHTSEANQIRKKYTDPDLGTVAADGNTEIDRENSFNTPDNTVRMSIYSVFGRAGYSYDNKYYGEFSFRYDASSRFLKGRRWGFFPSISAGWRLSQEGFMETYRQSIGDLKIRGSYGVLGNQNVGDYRYMTTYTIYNDRYGFNKAPMSGTGFTFGNEELTWEKTATSNIGFDAAFLKNQLAVSFDYFNQRTSDILLQPEIPNIFGGSVATENMGIMQNRGWEVTVNYRFDTKGVRHQVNFNVADSKNKVVDFGKEERINEKEQMSTLIREGVALNSYFGYKTAGFFKDPDDIANSALPVGAVVAPGDMKYVDYHEDGVIDEKDRQILGNAFPRYTFGLNYSANWKGFDFGVFIQGVGKREMVLRGELVRPYASNFTQTMFRHQLDYWSPTNQNARWPRLSADGSSSNVNNFGRNSDIYLLDVKYVRIKNLQLGYTLPKNISTKIGINKLRVYVNAQNLWTLSATSFIDPESSEFGNNMGGRDGQNANSGRNYPALKYYGCGLNLEF